MYLGIILIVFIIFAGIGISVMSKIDKDIFND